MGAFSVLNNISAENGQRQLNVINVRLSRALSRLSSGKRINSGADDAAGLQIADSLRGNAYALNQAVRNAGDGIAFLQMADGALQQMTDMLNRAVTLAEEAASDLISAEGRKALDAEFQAIQEEIARVALDANYNGMNIFIYDADSADYVNIEKQIAGLDPAADAAEIARLRDEQEEIRKSAEKKAQDIAYNPAVTVTREDLLGRAEKNRDFGETLDVFVGDLSAVSYINVNTGSIVVEKIIPPIIVPKEEMIMNKAAASGAVNPNGSFQFSAANTHGDAVPLLQTASSSLAIQVNGGLIYNIWGSTPGSIGAPLTPVSQSSDKMTTAYRMKSGAVSLEIVQKVSVASNPADIGGQSYKVDYEVKNTGSSSSAFSLLLNIDTQLGANDAPITVNGVDVTGNTQYVGGSIPESVEIYNDETDPLINGTIRFAPGSEPNRLNLGNDGNVAVFGALPSSSQINNYSYAAVWERTLAAGESTAVTSYYGVKNPPQEVLAGMDDILLGYEDESKASEKITKFGNSTGLYSTNLLTAGSAVRALSDIKATLNETSIMRGSIGAGVNRLQAAVSVLQTQAQNTLAAESVIRDADIAEELSNLTKSQILAQTGIAALAHANSNSRTALSLLQ